MSQSIALVSAEEKSKAPKELQESMVTQDELMSKHFTLQEECASASVLLKEAMSQLTYRKSLEGSKRSSAAREATAEVCGICLEPLGMQDGE